MSNFIINSYLDVAESIEWTTDGQRDTMTINGVNAYSSGTVSGGWKYRLNTNSGHASYEFELSRLSGSGNDIFCGLTDDPDIAGTPSPETFIDQAVYLTVNDAKWRLYSGGTKVTEWTDGAVDDTIKIEFTSPTLITVYSNGVSKGTMSVSSGYKDTVNLCFVPNSPNLNCELL